MIAGVFSAACLDDPDRCRHVAQLLAAVVAEVMQLTATAGAHLFRIGNVDDANFAWQVFQNADRLPARFFSLAFGSWRGICLGHVR